MADIQLFDILKMYTEKATGVNITSEAAPGQAAVSLVTPTLVAGTYLLGYSFQITAGQRDRPFFYGLSGDFADAEMFGDECADNDTLHQNFCYYYPVDWAGGPITVGLNFYKDSSLNTLVVDFADIIITRYN